MPYKKNYWSITMFNTNKIADKKYYGCSTPRSVQNFCNRYNVNWFWWTPPNSHRKIMMVDWQNFRDSYKEIYGTFRTTKSWPKPRKKTTISTPRKPRRRTSPKPKTKVSTRSKTYRYKTRRAA